MIITGPRLRKLSFGACCRSDLERAFMNADLWSFERECAELGYRSVCGIDEAGRGPLAGPVCAAAVILPMGVNIEGLNDSKKLSPKKREVLYDVICEKALAYGVAMATPSEIDEFNILNATFLAMQRAIDALSRVPDFALIDGDKIRNIKIPARSIVKGDSLSASIAAASILAKVSRDRYMEKLAEEYPQYCFEKHKGYPTKLHYERVEAFGLSEVHRKSFFVRYKGGVLL